VREPGRTRLTWVLGFLLITLLVVYAAFIFLYSSYRDRLEDELGQRLIAVASGAAAAVNGDSWFRITEGDPSARGEVRRELQEIQRINGVSDIFLFDTGEDLVLGLGEELPEQEFALVLSADLEAVTTAMAGLPAATRLFSSQGGFLKSAYAPVYDLDREVVGGVGVVASATFFEVLGQVRNTLFGTAAFVLVGVVLVAVVFARLLSFQDRLESRLRRTETLATMGQMTAMLAHEIRNPLGIIRGAAERLGERFGLQDDEVYRFIPEEVDRLEHTLGTYLDFARPGRSEEHDVHEALIKTLGLMGPELERKGIQVEADIEEGACPVRGDAHLLHQAFLNLVLNAGEAMGEGGTLRVSLSRRGRMARVVVTDTGVGMSEEVRRRATEAFFTSKEKGSGLGLAVVSRVIDDIGGKIQIESQPGEGTTVTLKLPLV